VANVANRFKKRALDTILTATTKIMLMDASYVFDADHDVVADVVADEVAGTGYTGGFSGAGRKTLANRTVTQDDTGDRAVFDADDVVYSGINVGVVSGVWLWRVVTSDADSELLAFLSGGFPKTTNGGDLNIQWSTLGLVQGA